MKKPSFVLITVMAWSLGILPATMLWAQVTGTCDNCHTMHNSQGGETVVLTSTGETTPQPALLDSDCLGCHTGTNTGSNTIPYVFSATEPTFGTDTLAGGNFYWVKEGNANASDAKGHNIFLNENDDDLPLAPGSAILVCGTDSCHLNLSRPFSDNVPELEGKYSCEGCHLAVAHHADDTGPIIDSAEEGWYRFLSGHDSGDGRGVAGIEDDDWQFTKDQADHNEYLGYEGAKDWYGSFSIIGANTMTAFCAGCHGQFHIQQGNDSWIRHPSDAVIPNEGEYASAFGAANGVGEYNPDVPVAREILTGVSAGVTMGSDMVMCLSCHVPHASPNDDLLRWDYNSMVAGTTGSASGTGCFVCHTNKDGL